MANTTDNLKMVEKRRKRDMKKRLFLIPKLFFVFALIFLVISIFFRAGSAVQTFTALKGNIEEYVLTDGYIFRNQIMVTSPIDGYLECNIKEGQRVNQNTVVATVYNGHVEPAVTEEISELKTKIESLENNKVEADVHSASAVKIELSISQEAENLAKIRENNSFVDVSAQKEIIDNYISRKQTALGNGKTDEDKLEECKSRLTELENSIEGERQELVAPTSGIFSSKIDGYEEVLNYDMLGDAIPSYLNNIKKNDVTPSSHVSSGETAIKIIDSYDWYFVGLVSEKEASNFEVGKSISLKFYDLSDSIVSGTIQTISKSENGKVAITVHSTKYIPSIYSTNKVSAELLTQDVEGIKVPSESLRVIDNQQGLYVVRLGVARFVPVELVYNNKEWAIVKAVLNSNYEESLEIYDEIIINSKGIEDGKVVRQ